MKKSIFFLGSILFFFTACEKDDPVQLSPGTYTATSVTEDLPVRAFASSGEINNTATIDQLLLGYNYISDSREISSFTAVELSNDVIRIYSSYIESTLLNVTVKYNYTMDREMLFLEMQDTIGITASYSDYYIQLFNTLNVYPLPEFKEEYIPTTTGYYVLSKYKDKRYIEIIDEQTIRRHFVRYVYVTYYGEPYQDFWVLPVELNNYFNETGYPVINEDDAILVKEFEIEYRKTSQ